MFSACTTRRRRRRRHGMPPSSTWGCKTSPRSITCRVVRRPNVSRPRSGKHSSESRWLEKALRTLAPSLLFATWYKAYWTYGRERAIRRHLGVLYFRFFILHWQFTAKMAKNPSARPPLHGNNAGSGQIRKFSFRVV